MSQDNHLRVGSYDSSFKDHVKKLGIYIAATLYVVKHTDQFGSTSLDQKSWLHPPSPDGESHCSADVFFCSQSVGLLQLFANWHQL